jgi:hypothetical protein
MVQGQIEDEVVKGRVIGVKGLERSYIIRR